MVLRKGRRPDTVKQTRRVPARDNISPGPSRGSQPETGATRQEAAHPANALKFRGPAAEFRTF